MLAGKEPRKASVWHQLAARISSKELEGESGKGGERKKKKKKYLLQSNTFLSILK